jgi:hypothetical protein
MRRKPRKHAENRRDPGRALLPAEHPQLHGDEDADEASPAAEPSEDCLSKRSSPP